MSEIKISRFETEEETEKPAKKGAESSVSARELHSFFENLINRHGRETIVTKKMGSDFVDDSLVQANFESDDRRIVVQSGADEDELTVATYERWQPHRKFHSAGVRWLLDNELSITSDTEISPSSVEAVLAEAEAIVGGASDGLMRSLGQRAL